jgi:hypothetical protein
MPILTASMFLPPDAAWSEAMTMSAVERSYQVSVPAPATADLHERFEALDEDEATALLAQRYAEFCAQGYDWREALLHAVELA